MKHDIDIINTAIRLGDRVVIPKGCVVKTVYDTYLHIFSVFFMGDILYFEFIDVNGRKIIRRYIDVIDNICEITFIPDNVPAFEEWDRI